MPLCKGVVAWWVLLALRTPRFSPHRTPNLAFVFVFVCVLRTFLFGGLPAACVQCKHLLAVRLAPVLGLSATEEVDDDKLAMRLSSCDYG